MKITKDTVGKKVWLVPTGNNVHRNGKTSLEQAKEVTITKIARVKGEFTFADSSHSQSFSLADYSDSAIRQGDNAGYEVYASLEHVKFAQKATEVRNYLRVNWQSLSDEKLHEIGEILSVELTKP